MLTFCGQNLSMSDSKDNNLQLSRHQQAFHQRGEMVKYVQYCHAQSSMFVHDSSL